jgi:hypothetical protein
MIKNKTFDCVQMKNDIQKGIIVETKGILDAQAHKVMKDYVVQDPSLSRFLTIREQPTK